MAVPPPAVETLRYLDKLSNLFYALVGGLADVDAASRTELLAKASEDAPAADVPVRLDAMMDKLEKAKRVSTGGDVPLQPGIRMSDRLRAVLQVRPATDGLYPFYAEAVALHEAACEKALVAWWRATASAGLLARWLDVLDRHGCLLPGVETAIRDVALPQHATLNAYVGKEAAATLAVDSDAMALRLEQALAAGLSAILGLAPPTGKRTDLARPLHAMALTLASGADAAESAYETASQTLLSFVEQARAATETQARDYVAPTARHCNDLWQGFSSFYAQALELAASTLDLQTALAAEAARLAAATTLLVDGYREGVRAVLLPLLPKLRTVDARALLDVREMRLVVAILDAVRPIMPKQPAWMADRALDQRDTVAATKDMPADASPMDWVHYGLARLMPDGADHDEVVRAYVALKQREAAQGGGGLPDLLADVNMDE